MTRLSKGYLILLLFFTTNLYAQLEFQSPKHIIGLRETVSLQTGDFDGDQLIDLAFTTESDSRIHVMYKESNGSYSKIHSYITENHLTTTDYSSKLTVSDYNNDGKSDIVVFNNYTSSSNKIFILISSGRDFTSPRIIETNSQLQGIALESADLNNDGNLDFIVGFRDLGTVFYVFLGDGNGNFTKKFVTNTAFTEIIRLADLNGDNNLDILSGNKSTPLLKVYLGDGTGDFEFATTLQTTSNPINFIVDDFSGDNVLDIIANTINVSSVDYFIGSVSGPYSKTTIPTSENFTPFAGISSFDYNNDSRKDFIISGFNNGDHLSLFTNLGNNQFSQTLYTDKTPSTTFTLSTVDSDQDGKFEIISGSSGRFLSIRQQSQGDAFDSVEFLPYGQLPTRTLSGDINSDGYTDLIIASEFNNSIGLYLGSSDETFTLSELFTTKGNPMDLQLEDFNLDGNADIIYCTQNGIGNGDEIGVLFSDVSGMIIGTASYPILNGRSLAVEDYNEDGYPDLLTNNSIYLSNGNGNYSMNSIIMPYTFDFKSGDFDNDGHQDFYATTTTEESIFYYGDGLGGFTANTFYLETGGLNIRIHDFDKDGLLDISTTNQNNNSISILKNKGNRTWEELRITHESFNFVTSLAAADFNRDGIDDLSIVNSYSSSVSIFLGKNTFEYEFFKTIAVGQSPWSVINVELNNDNRIDIVTFNAGPTLISVLYNDLVIEPTQASNNLIITSLSDTSVDISFTKGNGTGRIIVLREGESTTADPSDGTFYASNNQFGSGAQILVGQYVVYYGTNGSCQITNLKQNTSYYLEIFEFSSNSKNTLIDYLTNNTLTGMFKTKKSQTITFPAISSKEIGDPDVILNAIASSNLQVTYTVLVGGAEIAGNILRIISPGPVIIEASQQGDDDFASAPNVTVSFCINPLKPFVTYEASGNEIFLLTSSSSTNNIWLKNSIVISGQTNQTIEVEADAEYSVKVDYSGCSNTSASVKNQTITFPEISAKLEGQSDFQIVATSDSGLPVALTVVEGNVLINSTSVSVGIPGPTTIRASQPGNESYFPAASISRTFCVNPKKPEITISTSTTGNFILTSSSPVNNNWYRNGTLILGAIEMTYEPSIDGIYTVKVDYSGCSNTSSPTVNIITDAVEIFDQMSLYPNPVIDEFSILMDSNIEIKNILAIDSRGNTSHLIFNPSSNKINASSLSSGLFTLIIYSSHGISTSKLIKL